MIINIMDLFEKNSIGTHVAPTIPPSVEYEKHNMVQSLFSRLVTNSPASSIPRLEALREIAAWAGNRAHHCQNLAALLSTSTSPLLVQVAKDIDNHAGQMENNCRAVIRLLYEYQSLHLGQRDQLQNYIKQIGEQGAHVKTRIGEIQKVIQGVQMALEGKDITEVVTSSLCSTGPGLEIFDHYLKELEQYCTDFIPALFQLNLV